MKKSICFFIASTCLILFSGCGKEQGKDTEYTEVPVDAAATSWKPISSMKITSPSQIPDTVTTVYTNLSDIKNIPGVIRNGIPYIEEQDGRQVTTVSSLDYAGGWLGSLVKDENNLPVLCEVVPAENSKSNFKIFPGLLGTYRYDIEGNILYIELEWVDPEKGWLEVDSSGGKVLIPQYGLYNIVAYVDGKLYQKMQVKYEGEEDMTVLEGPDWKLRFFRGWLGE